MPDSFTQEMPYGLLQEASLVMGAGAFFVSAVGIPVCVLLRLDPLWYLTPPLLGAGIGLMWLNDYMKLKVKVWGPRIAQALRNREDGIGKVTMTPPDYSPPVKYENPQTVPVMIQHNYPADRHSWFEIPERLPIPLDVFRQFAKEAKDKGKLVGTDWYPKSKGKLLSQRQWNNLKITLEHYGVVDSNMHVTMGGVRMLRNAAIRIPPASLD
jgi:hypothetical protein